MMEAYNASIQNIPMPDRIKRLPVSPKGFPVPWFVAFIDGVPDFRVIEKDKIPEAVNKNKCWMCGESLGVYKAMILGPMCAINRTISEPPSHRECAVYAVTACPFLSNQKMRRNTANMPEGTKDPAGTGLKRNPGAVAIWITKSYSPFKAEGGVLFTFGDPEEVLWYAEGRAAMREEVEASISSGLPLLEEVAREQGPGAVAALKRATEEAMIFLPPVLAMKGVA